MSVSKNLSSPFPWFWIGLSVVFLISVYLRFWGLSRFNTLVFDEVYYAKFANNYLTHTQFFNAHPPLSQYLIAIAIWIGSHIPVGQDTVNSLTGSLRSTWSYRWLNALTGSFIPLVVAGIAYQLCHRGSYALLAAVFAAADGLFLVESRYALNNVYLVIFGLLGQWFLLLALDRYGRQRLFWLTLAGIGFGASAAIKWNGLWFLLGAYLIWMTAWVIQWVQSYQGQGDKGTRGEGDKRTRGQGDKGNLAQFSSSTSPTSPTSSSSPQASARSPLALHPTPDTLIQIRTPLENLTQLNWLAIVFYLGIIPVLVYSISWIPHLQLNPTPGFWEVQKRILEYHEHIGSGPKVHPYCSAWYTWLLMLRPVAYFYITSGNFTDPVPVIGPPLPAASARVIYDVHAIGNPMLWWFSTAAIVLLFLTIANLAVRIYQARGLRRSLPQGENPSVAPWYGQTAHPYRSLVVETSTHRQSAPRPSPLPTHTWISLYLVINWLANLLPWVRVTRCTFIYHYMGASVFAGLALAWLVDHWLHSYRRNFRALGVTAIFLILLAFVFWMPVYLGLPLLPEEYKLRIFNVGIKQLPSPLNQWLPHWI